MRFLLFLISTPTIAGEFTTSLGDQNPYTISAIATDAAGNTYIVGSRQLGAPSLTIGYLGAVFTGIPSFVPPGSSDVFLTKLDPHGQVLFTDTFAGKGIDTGNAIALDPSGNIYIAGVTTSADFPLSKALQTQSNPVLGTGFIIKLSNDGTTILYSTYFGGTLGGTSISSLATDAKGNLYLTGATTSADFPHTTGMPFGALSTSVSGAIIASISAAGDKILYSGAIVAPSAASLEENAKVTAMLIYMPTTGVGIAVDPAGNAYVAGNASVGYNNLGGFVAKVNAAGTGLSYLTYLASEQNVGGPPFSLFAIAVDAAGNAYLAGQGDVVTTPGTLQPVSNPPFDGFLAKLNPTGTAWVWATYLPGGGGGAIPESIALDAGGNVWATGISFANAFPNANGLPLTTSGPPDFLMGVNATGSKLTYSALFGQGTVAQSVAVDPSGLVHVAGVNGFVSAIAPSTGPAMKIYDFQNAFGGNLTARISPAEVITIYGPGIGGANAFRSGAAPVNGFFPKTLAGVQVTINGMNMPLLSVSSNQITAVVPMEIPPGAAAIVRVINGTSVSPAYPVWIVPSAPQAYLSVLNQDGSVNSGSNPATSNSVVTFYATGWQSNFSPLADGQVASLAPGQDLCQGGCIMVPGPAAPAALTVFPPNTAVLYAGAAPGIVAGVTQFNVRIGATQGSGAACRFNFDVIGPGTVSQSVWVAVSPSNACLTTYASRKPVRVEP